MRIKFALNVRVNATQVY